MASIRKHRNKWQIQVSPSGHVPVSRSFAQKTDAAAWARKVERDIGNGDLVANHKALNSVTVADLLPRYKDTITPTKRSAQVETYIIGAFLAHGLAGFSLRQLSAYVVAQYRDKRLKKVKPATVRQVPQPDATW